MSTYLGRKTKRAESDPIWKTSEKFNYVFFLNLAHADVKRLKEMKNVFELSAIVGEKKTHFVIRSAAEKEGGLGVATTMLAVHHANTNVEYFGGKKFKWPALLEFSKHLPVHQSQKDDILISLGAYLSRSKRKKE